MEENQLYLYYLKLKHEGEDIEKGLINELIRGNCDWTGRNLVG